MTPLPHEREPDRSEPDVCIHCRLPWLDLFTDRPEDECPVRLRAALDATPARGLRWVQHPNNRRVQHLVLGTGPHEITIGRTLSCHDRTLGHAILVSSGTWSELAKWTRQEAADYLCRHLGLDPVPL